MNEVIPTENKGEPSTMQRLAKQQPEKAGRFRSKSIRTRRSDAVPRSAETGCYLGRGNESWERTSIPTIKIELVKTQNSSTIMFRSRIISLMENSGEVERFHKPFSATRSKCNLQHAFHSEDEPHYAFPLTLPLKCTHALQNQLRF